MLLDNFIFNFYSNFIELSFNYMKYVLVFILITIGTLTLLRLRGIYLNNKLCDYHKEKKVSINQIRLILGLSYIFFGIGILFNYLIYFLLWILGPLPDKILYIMIKSILDFQNLKYFTFINSYSLNLIDLVFGLASFIFLIELLLSIWHLIYSDAKTKKKRFAFIGIVSGLMGCIFFGFTTFMPYIL